MQNINQFQKKLRIKGIGHKSIKKSLIFLINIYYQIMHRKSRILCLENNFLINLYYKLLNEKTAAIRSRKKKTLFTWFSFASHPRQRPVSGWDVNF